MNLPSITLDGSSPLTRYPRPSYHIPSPQVWCKRLSLDRIDRLRNPVVRVSRAFVSTGIKKNILRSSSSSSLETVKRLGDTVSSGAGRFKRQLPRETRFRPLFVVGRVQHRESPRRTTNTLLGRKRLHNVFVAQHRSGRFATRFDISAYELESPSTVLGNCTGYGTR